MINKTRELKLFAQKWKNNILNFYWLYFFRQILLCSESPKMEKALADVSQVKSRSWQDLFWTYFKTLQSCLFKNPKFWSSGYPTSLGKPLRQSQAS